MGLASISAQLQPFISTPLNPGGGGGGRRKEIPIFVLLFSHLHRLMLKVCLRIVCNYACLHTKALLCVKVWKPFVAWGCEEEAAQTNFKQDQRHETRWQTGALWLQTWLLPHSNMLFGAAAKHIMKDKTSDSKWVFGELQIHSLWIFFFFFSWGGVYVTPS